MFHFLSSVLSHQCFRCIEAEVWIDGNIIFAGLLSLNRHEADYLYHVKSIVTPTPPGWADWLHYAGWVQAGQWILLDLFIYSDAGLNFRIVPHKQQLTCSTVIFAYKVFNGLFKSDLEHLTAPANRKYMKLASFSL